MGWEPESDLFRGPGVAVFPHDGQGAGCAAVDCRCAGRAAELLRGVFAGGDRDMCADGLDIARLGGPIEAYFSCIA